MSRSESVTLGTGLIAETNTFASTRIAGTGVATEAHRVYRRAAGGYFEAASASISASTFATSGAKSIPWSSSRMRRASSCGSNRWSHRLPSFPSMRRNLVPGAMPCASRVSFGITILPARSTGTTVVINGIDTMSSISWYRRHDLLGSRSRGFPRHALSGRTPRRRETVRALCGTPDTERMWGELSTALLVGLALAFYVIAGYHTILIFLGLRMTRGGPKPFDKGSLRNPVDLPSVSIVIPARDEEIVIEGALRCADRLQYPSELKEVLLVEDGSVDATPTIGQRIAAALPNVQCLSGGLSKGKPLALNRAIAHARGDVIAVFDSDTRYQPDLLLRVAKYFHDHPDVSVVQAVPRVMNQHTNAITRLNYYETRFWFQGLQAAKERFGLFMHLAGTGMFLRRSVLEALGPWDEACLTEDLEYSLRLSQSGVRVGMLDANVWIQPVYRASHLVRQRERWWSGALQAFARAARHRFRVGRSRRERIDAFLYTCSPLVFLVSSLLSFGSLALFAITGSVPAALLAWLYGLLASQVLFAPLVIAEAVLTRDRKVLWLLPGLYAYWILQLAALIPAAFRVALRPRNLPWHRTPKLPSD